MESEFQKNKPFFSVSVLLCGIHVLLVFPGEAEGNLEGPRADGVCFPVLPVSWPAPGYVYIKELPSKFPGCKVNKSRAQPRGTCQGLAWPGGGASVGFAAQPSKEHPQRDSRTEVH